ncbi:MAG: succinate dehydrogenase/fumarate reductase iron-sulfur subunit [Thermoplasmata archaeon]
MDKVIFRIKRGNAEKWEYRDYEVPIEKGTTILDGLYYIRDNIDHTLSFRASCRMEVCGSCAMMVNNFPRTTCSTQIANVKSDGTKNGLKVIKLEPLSGYPWIRDLVVDFDDFFKKHESIKPYIIRKETPEGQLLQSPEQLAKYKQLTLCIKCGACVAACPISNSDPLYLGPAALAAAYRFNADSRDEGKNKRLAIVSDPEGCWRCHFSAECSEACPKDVDPASAIQKLKVQAAVFEFKRIFTGRKDGEK